MINTLYYKFVGFFILYEIYNKDYKKFVNSFFVKVIFLFYSFYIFNHITKQKTIF